MDPSTVLSSGVVAGLVAGLVTLRGSERKIQIENITQERAKWREKIRANALLVYQAAEKGDLKALGESRLAFQLLLNPFDAEDMAIIGSITALTQTPDPKPRLPEFAGRVSYLLKHDWERAKAEAKPWFFRRKPPARKPFP
jgi:hypothetical protein